MASITFGPDGGVTFEPFSLEDVVSLLKGLKRPDDNFLVYGPEEVAGFYAGSSMNWLTAHSRSGPVIAPYSIEVDYRSRPEDEDWSRVRALDRFVFPEELMVHRREMIEIFKEGGRLFKGDIPSVRVSKLDEDQRSPTFFIQQSSYYDQVGSNLTVDYQLKNPIKSRGKEYTTVRMWDKSHAKKSSAAPSLENSRLANTIGVAVGVTAPDDNGKQHILMRKRRGTVAVYQRQWHVPFSFGLEWPSTLRAGQTISLRTLLNSDWGHELAQELNLDSADFRSPRPLVFARDWVRGGKPQFFFHLPSKLTVGELMRRAGSDPNEYKRKIRVLNRPNDHMSSELLAVTLLLNANQED